MRRREFFTAAAGIGAGTVLANAVISATADDRVAERRSQVYKCRKCGTIVEILVPGRPSLVHCGEPMKLLQEQTTEIGREKHVPVVEKIEDGYKVTVGSIPHPMQKAHYIVWIDLIADGKVYRRFLNPGEKPEATFHIDATEVTAREYCNLHGLWKGK